MVSACSLMPNGSWQPRAPKGPPTSASTGWAQITDPDVSLEWEEVWAAEESPDLLSLDLLQDESVAVVAQLTNESILAERDLQLQLESCRVSPNVSHKIGITV